MNYKTILSIKKPLAFILGLSLSASCMALDVPAPLLLDKTLLSGVNLKKVSEKGEADKFSNILYDGKGFDVRIEARTAGKITVGGSESDQFIRVMNGALTLTENSGKVQHFTTGDFFVVPKGFSGVWEFHGLDYPQLLIIETDKRSDVSKVKNMSPFLIDRDLLSGLNMKKIVWPMKPDTDFYSDKTYEGSELDVAVVAAAPNEAYFPKPMTEEFVYVITGTAVLTPEGGKPQRFSAGDIFVVPGGFYGQWDVEGMNQYRELIAVPSK